jgi:thioredoxin 1
MERETAVLQFSAPWCGPCKNQSIIVDEVVAANNLGFAGKIDIEEEIDLSSEFKVQSVPTIVVLHKGKESKRFVGFQTRQKLEEALAV